jgi:hypothetical protein
MNCPAASCEVSKYFPLKVEEFQETPMHSIEEFF